MKKLLLTAFFAFAGITAQAQLTNGTTAPDFTATDINGVSHTLSSYLAQGKTVIIDVSATWCAPCWAYHHSGALEDTYYSYGEGGSNEIVVLFIEGDPRTSVQSIYGTNPPGDYGITQGDWTQGSPYPIIDDTDGSISDAYNINFFPTVYRICPDGKVTVLTQPSATAIKTSVNSGCGTLTGVTNNTLTTTDNVFVCESTGTASAKIKNYGTNAITSATLQVKQGNTVVTSKDITGNFATFASTDVVFDSAEFNPALDYTIAVTAVNGGTPSIANNAVAFLDAVTAGEGHNNIVVNVHTDNYPSEISWKIRTSEGTVVASGGPYQAGTADQWGGGGPDANTTKTHQVTLPGTASDCYTVEFIDGFGDGWSLGNTPHGIDIWSASGIMFYKNVGGFGSSLSIPSAFKANGTLDTPTLEATTFALYPNPTTGVLNFSTRETVSVTIVDLTGKTVYTANNINDGASINLSGLQKGMYIAQIKGETIQKSEKVIIN